MTLQNRTDVYAPATLTDEQRRRVADALDDAQSENTRKNYASQFRKFRAWCECEDRSPLPASPEVVAAYAAENADDGKSISTVRLAVSAIVDARRRVGLAVTMTRRGAPLQVVQTHGRCKRWNGCDSFCWFGDRLNERREYFVGSEIRFPVRGDVCNYSLEGLCLRPTMNSEIGLLLLAGEVKHGE